MVEICIPHLDIRGFTGTTLLILSQGHCRDRPMVPEGGGGGGHSWWMCVFVVVRLFDKEEKTQQSEAPGLHRGSGDIKG